MPDDCNRYYHSPRFNFPGPCIVPTPSRCHCEEERRSNPAGGQGSVTNPQETDHSNFSTSDSSPQRVQSFRPRPCFEQFLPTDRRLSRIEPLIVDKTMKSIALTESREISVLMLPDSAMHLPRHSRIERAVSFVGEDIDVVALSDNDHG